MDDVDSQPQVDAAPKKKGLSPRVKTGLLVALVVIVVALAIWFIHYQTRGKYYEGTNDAYIKADAVTVSPKVSGYVEQVFVADNQDVKAGQPLIRIDARDYKAQTAQYQAQIDVAEANADNVRAGLRERAVRDAHVADEGHEQDKRREVGQYDVAQALPARRAVHLSRSKLVRAERL